MYIIRCMHVQLLLMNGIHAHAVGLRVSCAILQVKKLRMIGIFVFINVPLFWGMPRICYSLFTGYMDVIMRAINFLISIFFTEFREVTMFSGWYLLAVTHWWWRSVETLPTTVWLHRHLDQLERVIKSRAWCVKPNASCRSHRTEINNCTSLGEVGKTILWGLRYNWLMLTRGHPWDLIDSSPPFPMSGKERSSMGAKKGAWVRTTSPIQ